MSDDSFELIERQLASGHVAGAPSALREGVLRNVQCELRAARWDRRLARVAVVLLVVGLGLNAATLLPGHARSSRLLAVAPNQESIVQVAISVAEATDIRTGRQVARRLAAMAGRPLSGDDAAALDAAVERRTSHGFFDGKEG
jgi:hypothetical protein